MAMPGHDRVEAAPLVEDVGMSNVDNLRSIAARVAESLASSRVRGDAAYISTSVTYPNGTGVTVKICQAPNGFYVSDEGYGGQIADMMGGSATYTKTAPLVASRSGVQYGERTFFTYVHDERKLTAAVSAVANASAKTADRVAQTLEQMKFQKSRDVFDGRLRAAFGERVAFDVTITGGTGRSWDYDAAVDEDDFKRVFTLVSPAFQAIAAANLKIVDTLALPSPPRVTTVLTDYDRTEPALRAILSDTGSIVIGATEGVERYKLAS